MEAVATHNGLNPARVSDPGMPPPEGIEQPVERRKPIINRQPIRATTSLGDIAGGFIPGLDDPDGMDEETATGRPWYELQTADDVDKVNAAIEMEEHYEMDRIAISQMRIKMLQERKRRLLSKYQDLIQVVAPVKEGGKFATWRGKSTGGTYRNQPERLPEIKWLDKVKAKLAGFIVGVQKIVDVEQTALVRAAKPEELTAAGIALIPQQAVSYSPAKGK